MKKGKKQKKDVRKKGKRVRKDEDKKERGREKGR